MTSEPLCGTPLTSPYWLALAVTLTIAGHLAGLRVHPRRRCLAILIHDASARWAASLATLLHHWLMVTVGRCGCTINPLFRDRAGPRAGGPGGPHLTEPHESGAPYLDSEMWAFD
jgi:hypothetical protein